MRSRHTPSPTPFSWRLLAPLLSRSGKPEPGLTLIECLVAIVIISITVVAITPPIFVATASRIQSRRAEQANQIAQAEVDRVRTLMERGVAKETQLPELGTAAASGPNTSVLASVGQCAETKYPFANPLTQAPGSTVIPVDVDGDCEPEFAMQVVRTNDCRPPAIPPIAVPYSFDLTVRVYAYKDGDTMTTLGKDRMRLGLTTGRAGDDPAAAAGRQPMQVLTTKVSRVGQADSVTCVDGTP